MAARDREFIDGAEAIARGALDAGCDFFAGYPITPASGILMHMLRELPKVGGNGIQGEDEIASIGFCIGAALAGAKPMTATSGPGLALYAENIGVGVMVEVPLVIVVVQRLGPSTGAATAGAQGDIQFIRWGTSGGYPIIALCPTDAAEAYHLTGRAFELASRFRVPVFLATDKEVVMTADTVAAERMDAPPPDWPAVPHASVARPLATFAPGSQSGHEASQGTGDPPASSGVGGAPASQGTGDPSASSGVGGDPASQRSTGDAAATPLLRHNASSHDSHGYITKDPATLDELNRRLASKIADHADELELVRFDEQAGARTLVLSFGVTARSVGEAVDSARASGGKVSSLTLFSLWPVPETAIRRAAAGVERVVVAELNLGQYKREIERIVGADAEVIGVNRVDGGLIAPDQILAEVLL